MDTEKRAKGDSDQHWYITLLGDSNPSSTNILGARPRRADGVKVGSYTLFKFDTANCEVEEQDGGQLVMSNENETLIISRSYSAAFSYFDISYSGDVDRYSMLLDLGTRRRCGLSDEVVDLSFMTADEAAAYGRALTAKLVPGLTSECEAIQSFSADDLNALKSWLYENDEMYQGFIDEGKIQTKETFDAGDEAYVMSFGFAIDGLPIYGLNDYNVQSYSEDEMPIARKMYCRVVLTKDGVIDFELQNCASITSAGEKAGVATTWLLSG